MINGSGAVKPDTRARISLAIAELGYTGNLAARMLATRRSRAIGVLAPEANDFGPTSTLHALEFAARDRGYRLIVTTCLDTTASIRESLSLLMQQAVEAIVVVAPSARAATMIASHQGCPVLPLQKGRDLGAQAVYVDQEAGVNLAMQHLSALGHTRIQALLGPDRSVEAVQRRAAVEGFRSSANLPRAVHLLGDWSARSGFAAAQFVDQSTTAVFCSNDQMALGLIAGLRTRELNVPGDVSVVGFDNVPEAAYFSPPLTTVEQDFARIGALAIEQLDAVLSGLVPFQCAISPQLVVRGSTRRID